MFPNIVEKKRLERPTKITWPPGA